MGHRMPDDSAHASLSRPWMRSWLIAAGIYNLAWGGLTVLAPWWLFSLTGMEQPRYPFIWQCVGMIVGVYGIGYLAAASDPLRHWPIVLVGLLGKIFGPIGYLGGVLQGEVPPAFGVTLPTNDLLWWVPFTMILLAAWRARSGVPVPGVDAERPAPPPLSTSRTTTAVCWLAVSLLASAGLARAADEPTREPLWPAAPPQGAVVPAALEVQADENAFLSIHRPATPNGTAAVICPGGGYGGLVVGAEGHGIAAWLEEHGITGIVLEYRLPAGRGEVPWLDAARAIRSVRARAEELQLDPHRIGIIGFSAGGHLAATTATLFDDGDASSSDAIERVSSRPDFAILVYPVITMAGSTHSGSRRNLLGDDPPAAVKERFSPDLQVTDASPPAFLAHAVDDTAVTIDNSERFLEACQAKGVPARLLRLPDGGHGLNGYKGPSWDAWQAGSLAWLHELGMIP